MPVTWVAWAMRALHAGPGGVFALPGLGVLFGAGGGDGFVDLAGPQGELPSGPGGGGAFVPDGAVPAGAAGELDDDHVAAVLAAGAPVLADGAFGAGNLRRVPVDGEHVRGVSAGAGLAAGIGQQRGDQGDAAGARGEEQLRAGVAGIHGVLAG